MSARSNLKVLASAVGLDRPARSATRTPPRPSNKALTSVQELKRRGESDAHSRNSRSDASSHSGGERPGLDSDGNIRRKADSAEGLGGHNSEEAEVFFDCEEVKLSVESPAKKKNERETARLIAKVNGKAKLRYWDSADHMAIS